MIDLLTNVRFAHPWVFLLLLLVPFVVLWLKWQRTRRYPNLRMPTLAGVEKIVTWRTRLRTFLPWLRGLALLCLVIALARPQLTLFFSCKIAELSSSSLKQLFTAVWW